MSIFKKHLGSYSGFAQDLFVGFAHNFSAKGVSMVAGLIAGFFFARFLGPEEYGTWKTAVAIGQYGAIFGLGVASSMRRDFIQLNSSGKHEEAKEINNQVFTYNVLIHIISLIGLLIISIFFINDNLLSISLIAIAIYQIPKFWYEYGKILNISFDRFNNLSRAEVIKGLLQLSIIPFAYFYGVYAVLIGFVLMHAGPSIYYFLKRPLKSQLKWDFKLIKKLIKIGFPFYLTSIASIVFNNIDRLIIADMLSFKSVGLYTLGALLTQPVMLILKSTAEVLFTKLNLKHGYTVNKSIIKQHVIIPQLILSNLVPPIIGALVVMLPVITNLILPEYKGGIFAAQIKVFAIYSQIIAVFVANALFLINRQQFTLYIFVFAGVIKVVGIYLLLSMGYGIEAVAFTALVAYFIYDNLMFLIIVKSMNMNISYYFNTLIKKTMPFFIIIIICYLIEFYINEFYKQYITNNDFLILFFNEILILIISLPFILKALNIINSLKKQV